MIARLSFQALLLVAVLAGLAACGGHAAHAGAAKDASPNAICARTDPQLRAAGVPAGRAQARAASGLARTELRALISVPAPAGGAAAYKRLLAERNAELVLLQRLASPLPAAQVRGVRAALVAHARRGNADARALGLTACRQWTS